jgi:hypothetical protein
MNADVLPRRPSSLPAAGLRRHSYRVQHELGPPLDSSQSTSWSLSPGRPSFNAVPTMEVRQRYWRARPGTWDHVSPANRPSGSVVSARTCPRVPDPMCPSCTRGVLPVLRTCNDPPPTAACARRAAHDSRVETLSGAAGPSVSCRLIAGLGKDLGDLLGPFERCEVPRLREGDQNVRPTSPCSQTPSRGLGVARARSDVRPAHAG